MYETLLEVVRSVYSYSFYATSATNLLVIYSVVVYMILKKETTAMYNHFAFTMAISNIVYSLLYWNIQPGYVVHQGNLHVVFLGYPEYTVLEPVTIVLYWIFVVVSLQNIMNPILFTIYRHRTVKRALDAERPKFRRYIFCSLFICGTIVFACSIFIYLTGVGSPTPATDRLFSKMFLEKVKYIVLPLWTRHISTVAFFLQVLVMLGVPLFYTLTRPPPVFIPQKENSPDSGGPVYVSSVTYDLIFDAAMFYFGTNIPLFAYIMFYHNSGLDTGLTCFPIYLPTVCLPAMLPMVIFAKVKNYRKTAIRGLLHIIRIRVTKVEKKKKVETTIVTTMTDDVTE